MRKLHALLLAVLVTIGFGTIYVVAQQYGRSAANDAPIALAQSVASSLSTGASPASLVDMRLDTAATYQPFFVVYDQNFRPLAGTGYLNGELAHPDSGVFTHTAAGMYHTVTWQPQSGVRVASVETKAGSYYVLAGQSLKLTENRDDIVLALAAFGWLVSVGCLVMGYCMLQPRPVKRRK
jgi:hypothetical protein